MRAHSRHIHGVALLIASLLLTGCVTTYVETVGLPHAVNEKVFAMQQQAMAKTCSEGSEQRLEVRAEATLTKHGAVRQRVETRNECRSAQKQRQR